MCRRNSNIGYVSKIVIVTRRPSITQGTRWLIGISETGSKRLLHLISGDYHVSRGPPHFLCVPIFSIRNQPKPTDFFLKFRQCEVADLGTRQRNGIGECWWGCPDSCSPAREPLNKIFDEVT